MKANQKADSKPLTIREILYRDYLRIRNKGTWGIIASIVMLVSLLQAIEMFGDTVWPRIIELMKLKNIERWQFYFFGSWTLNIVSFALSNVLFSLCYALNLPFFEQYKIIKGERWPWIEDYKAWKTMVRKTLGILCINSLVVFPCFVWILVAVINRYQVRHSFDVEDLPTKWTLVWQLIFCLLIEDVGFSCAHRLLHSYPFLYKNIHKLHHEYT
jgi:sterol desaturase/sphingolipid hydroxylase (fatty acid hydroxylase superfamily)